MSSPLAYPYSRADGAAVARPLFQEGDGGSIPTSALHLQFHRVELGVARQLNALWHSKLPEFPVATGGLSYHDAFVAEFDGHWFAAAIWSGPVNRTLNDGATYELRRFAIAPCAPRNTASRMLGWMAREIRRTRPEIRELISYQLMDVHAGTIYRASGWRDEAFSRGHGWDKSEGGGRDRPLSQQPGDKRRWHLTIRELDPAPRTQTGSRPAARSLPARGRRVGTPHPGR